MTNPYTPPVSPAGKPQPPAKPPRNYLSDFVAAGVLFGAVMGGLSWAAFTQLQGAPDIEGIPRPLALGVPTAALSAAFFLTGLWVFVSGSKLACLSMCAVSFVMLALEVAFELHSTGSLFAFKLISLVFYATPFVLLRSLGGAMRQIDAERAARVP